MRVFRTSRKQRHGCGGETDRNETLRRRCAAGAVAAGAAYLAVLTIAAVRPTALRQPVAYGLLTGSESVAALCTLGAVLAASEARRAKRASASARQVDDIDWAIHFGAEVAEAFPDRGLGNAVPRGPSIR